MDVDQTRQVLSGPNGQRLSTRRMWAPVDEVLLLDRDNELMRSPGLLSGAARFRFFVVKSVPGSRRRFRPDLSYYGPTHQNHKVLVNKPKKPNQMFSKKFC